MPSQNSGELCSFPISELLPAEQAALLRLRGCIQSRAVLAKLKHSTVRIGHGHFCALIARGLARQSPISGRYMLTPRGFNVASAVLRDLIVRLQIVVQPPAPVRGVYQRQTFVSQSTA
jgi:hypothetical protein